MKKLYIILLFLGISSLALANNRNLSVNNFDGFYLGAHAGVLKGDSSNSTNVWFGDNYSLTNKAMKSESKPTFGLHLGYGKQINKFYIGAEILSNFIKHEDSGESQSIDIANQCILTNKIKIKMSGLQYGIDLRPGFVINPTTLFYGRLGIMLSRFKLSSLNRINIIYASSADFNFTKSQYKPGLRLGLGVEEYLSHKISLHLEYIYTYYKDIKLDEIIHLGAPEDPPEFTNKTKISPRTQNFIFGINYYF
jgi:opacity protein-like surface antigen